MRRRLGVAVLAVSLCAGLAACTGGGDQEAPQSIGPVSESSSTATTSGTGSTTAPKPDQTFPAEQQPVIDAYYGYYDALYAIRDETDDQIRQALSPHAIPERVEKVVATFSGYRSAGKQQSGSPGYRELQLSANAGAATIIECRDSSSETVIELSTGQILGSGSANNRLQTEMVLDSASGQWLVSKAFADADAC